MDLLQSLFEAAVAARAQSYAPYSGFAVGAAIRGAGGGLYCGTNVENSAYPLGICAESSAIASMVLAGERAIADILIVADSVLLVTPCGGCRQRLQEFGRPETKVHVAGLDGWRASYALGDLLPEAFGPKTLESARA